MQKLFWPSAGGTALALVLFIAFPKRRRSWLAMVGLLLLFACVGTVSCGGGLSSRGNSGTTPGAYTITVTGTAGTISATVGTVTLTVQ